MRRFANQAIPSMILRLTNHEFTNDPPSAIAWASECH
jgi:hypothetical protein